MINSLKNAERELRRRQLNLVFKEPNYSTVYQRNYKTIKQMLRFGAYLKDNLKEIKSNTPKLTKENIGDEFTVFQLGNWSDNTRVFFKKEGSELKAYCEDRGFSSLFRRRVDDHLVFKAKLDDIQHYRSRDWFDHDTYDFINISRFDAKNKMDELRYVANILKEYKDCDRNLETNDVLSFLYRHTQYIIYKEIVDNLIPNVDPIVLYEELKDFHKDIDKMPLDQFVDKYGKVCESHEEEIEITKTERKKEEERKREKEIEAETQKKVEELNKHL